MDKTRACEIINNKVESPPGTEVAAIPHRNFDDAVIVELRYAAYPSQFGSADNIFPPLPLKVPDVVRVGDIDTEEDLAVRVADAFIRLAAHEIREFTRLRPGRRAPVHPHRGDGIDRWAKAHGTDPQLDYKFGRV